MKKVLLKNIFIMIVLVSCGLSSFAGDVKHNGGDGVYLSETQSVVLYDLYESSIDGNTFYNSLVSSRGGEVLSDWIYGPLNSMTTSLIADWDLAYKNGFTPLAPGISPGDVALAVGRLLNHLSQIHSPLLANAVLDKLIGMPWFFAYLQNNEDTQPFVGIGNEAVRIPCASNRLGVVTLSLGCISSMDVVNFSALMIHEAVYSLMDELKLVEENNSFLVRTFIATLFKKKNQRSSDYLRRLIPISSLTVDNNYYFSCELENNGEKVQLKFKSSEKSFPRESLSLSTELHSGYKPYYIRNKMKASLNQYFYLSFLNDFGDEMILFLTDSKKRAAMHFISKDNVISGSCE